MSLPATVLKSVKGPFKPSLSKNHAEARNRALNLYRSWWRQLPIYHDHFKFPLSLRMMRKKLKEKFRENNHITDLRVIDMLIIKGHLDLHEVVNYWAQSSHLLKFWNKEIMVPKRTDFMSKFLAGKSSD